MTTADRSRLQEYINALRQLCRVFTEAARPIEFQRDLRDVRRRGEIERRAARDWLDHHLDTVYADLGLERAR